MDKEPRDSLKKLEIVLKEFILWIEVLLAVFIMITVIVSIKDVVILISDVFITEPNSTYNVLQGLLSHILLLVVGLELALMLISHTAGSVLEVILYAIARTMLISSTNSLDIILGVISIAMIFAIDKYLHTKDVKRFL